MRISDWSSDVCSSDLRERCVERDVGELVVGSGASERLELRPDRVPRLDQRDHVGGCAGQMAGERDHPRILDQPELSGAAFERKDRKSGLKGERESERVDTGGRGPTKKKTNNTE